HRVVDGCARSARQSDRRGWRDIARAVPCAWRACAPSKRADHAGPAALNHPGRALGRRRCDFEIRRLRRSESVAHIASGQSTIDRKTPRMTHPHLAITMGDPAGIGPEIIVKACEKLRPRIDAGDLRLLIIGSGAALKTAA